MKKKAIAIVITSLILVVVIATMGSKVVTAENDSAVEAFYDRQYMYEANVDDDVIDNVVLDGLRGRSYYIRPQNVLVYDASIVMNTSYPEYYFPSIVDETWDPPADFTTDVVDGKYLYTWEFIDPISPYGQGAVWLNPIKSPVSFKPEFTFQRTIDPVLITKEETTQEVTIEFTPSGVIDFHNAHVSIHVQETFEVSPSFVEGSNTSDLEFGTLHGQFLEEHEDFQSFNWGVNPAGGRCTFTIAIDVVNKLYPVPVIFKPSIGVGANFNDYQTEPSPAENVTVEDDINGVGVIDNTVTYSGTGSLLNWRLVVQNEYSVNFPCQSTITGKKGHFWATFVSTTGEEVWSNLYGFGHMSTPWYGKIVEWDVSEEHYDEELYETPEDAEDFTGTFTIAVKDQTDYIEGGLIQVSFDTELERIPLITGEPNAHIHFSGDFNIIGGTGQYSGLLARGKISGTIHLHDPIDVLEPYYDFVLIGKWGMDS